MLLSQDRSAAATPCNVASARALAQTETFDLLISDLGLPDASGYRLMARKLAVQPLPELASQRLFTSEEHLGELFQR
jgi:DNA-binding response OmpR family regulator